MEGSPEPARVEAEVEAEVVEVAEVPERQTNSLG